MASMLRPLEKKGNTLSPIPIDTVAKRSGSVLPGGGFNEWLSLSQLHWIHKGHLIHGTCSAYYGSATFWIHIDMFP